MIRGVVRYVHKHGPWNLWVDACGQDERLRVPPGWTGEGIIARLPDNRTTLVLYSPDDPQGRDILGKTDHDLFPAFLADQFLADDEYVLAGNRIVDRVELSHLPDGTTVWHVTNKIPLRGRDGAIIGTAGSTRPLDKSGPGRGAGD